MLFLTVHCKALAAGSALAYNYLFCYCFHIFRNHFQEGAFLRRFRCRAGGYCPGIELAALQRRLDMWTRQTLHDLISSKMAGYRFIVVANREPFIHRYVGDQIVVIKPASGMVTAIDPIMDASGGTWIAHGNGDADIDVVDAFDRIRVPPDNPTYTLRRVWLTKEQEQGFYYGLANEGLWPLCHVTFTPPKFRPEDWEMYRQVNRLYADAVLQEAGDQPTFVFIQDYHFCLLPRMLKQANSNLIVAQFWHIPWPNLEVFRAFPWKEELLDGLLGNDLLGFHIRYHCQNFLDTLDRTIEARVDTDRFLVTSGGQTTAVRDFPDQHRFCRTRRPVPGTGGGCGYGPLEKTAREDGGTPRGRN